MAASITYVNHATLLIQLNGVTVLTDPIYSRTLTFFIPRRQKPGIPFAHLPSIDYVVVSHSDYDHLNLKTLRKLRRRGATTIVVPHGLRRYCRKAGFEDIIELRSWEFIERPNARITCTPAKHQSKRTAWDRTGSSCCGFVIEAHGQTVFFAGDTGYDPLFSELGGRFSIDAALLPIGAYRPEKWFKNLHLHPATALRAFQDLRAKHLVPYHWGTFCISDEPMAEPPQLLLAEAERQNIRERVHVLNNGESLHL